MHAVRAWTPRATDPPERATTLVLVPVMMIVFIALAGIAVDLTTMHMAKRRSLHIVSLAASDAAGMIDDRALQLTGDIRIDRPRAERVVGAHIGAQDLVGTIVDGPHVIITPDGQAVTVSLRLRIEHIFLGSIPSLRFDDLTVHSTARLTTAGP